MVQILPPQPIRYLQKQVPFFLPSGYGVAEGNGATAPIPMKGLFSGAKRQPRSITRRFGKKGAAPRDLWKIAGLRAQPIRYLQKQVPFFLPSGYGVAEGNGATAPSPMKGLFSGAKRQPRSITRRFEEKRCCPTRFVENRWATHATMLCIQNRCHSKNPRCHKASGIFCAYFQSAILIDAKRQKCRAEGI